MATPRRASWRSVSVARRLCQGTRLLGRDGGDHAYGTTANQHRRCHLPPVCTALVIAGRAEGVLQVVVRARHPVDSIAVEEVRPITLGHFEEVVDDGCVCPGLLFVLRDIAPARGEIERRRVSGEATRRRSCFGTRAGRSAAVHLTPLPPSRCRGRGVSSWRTVCGQPLAGHPEEVTAPVPTTNCTLPTAVVAPSTGTPPRPTTVG